MKNLRGTYLFTALLLFLQILLSPYAHAERVGLIVVLQATLAVAMISGLRAASAPAGSLNAGLTLGAITVVLATGEWLLPGRLTSLHAAPDVCLLALIALAGYHMLRAVLLAREVNADTIFGAVSVYVIMGTLWAVAYTVAAQLTDGAFSLDLSEQSEQFGRLLYFSFVTQTTLGYGDIAPTNGTTEALVMLQAILGPLYLTILVARLVSLHLHGTRAREER